MHLTSFNTSEYIVKFLLNKTKVIIFYPNQIYSFNLNTFKYENLSAGDSYVPTTTISINPIADEESTRKIFEYSNLLNNQRKNTLIGKLNTDLQFNFAYFVVDYSLLDTSIHSINDQSIFIKDEDAQSSNVAIQGMDNTVTFEGTFVGFDNRAKSFSLRSLEKNIYAAISYHYTTVYPYTQKLFCRVYDKDNNLVYDNSKVNDQFEFFNINTTEANEFKILYETEVL